MLGSLFSLIAAGADAHVSTGVQDALGRAATPFQEWVAREVPVTVGSGQAAGGS